MKWEEIKSIEDLDTIKSISEKTPVLIFKHSTRCSISSMALSRLERAWKETDNEKITPFYLDLINYKPISNQIATDFRVPHESPQVLVIKDGKSIYDTSHSSINYHDILDVI